MGRASDPSKFGINLDHVHESEMFNLAPGENLTNDNEIENGGTSDTRRGVLSEIEEEGEYVFQNGAIY